MIAIVASRRDRVARKLAHLWAEHGAALLTCEDLSTSGWSHSPGAVGGSTVVIGGRSVSEAEVTGVLTRRPYVAEHELALIAPEDRAYVAAEMTAFLLSWLSILKCPVLNRPTPSGLSGPNRWPEQWTHAAAGLGIPVRPVVRRAASPHDALPETKEPPHTTATVVGDHCFGSDDTELCEQARRIAGAAGVDLLAVWFDGDGAFLGADLWPDVSSPPLSEAVLEYLIDGRR